MLIVSGGVGLRKPYACSSQPLREMWKAHRVLHFRRSLSPPSNHSSLFDAFRDAYTQLQTLRRRIHRRRNQTDHVRKGSVMPVNYAPPLEIDERCFKCPAVLICLSGVFGVVMQKCDYCKRRMLSVSFHDIRRNTYTDTVIIVKCDKYKHVEGVLCERCNQRQKKKGRRLP